MDCSELHTAVLSQNVPLVSQLLWSGADPDMPSWQHRGNTPLLVAASLGHIQIVRLLCNHGCSVNALTIHGETALHLAILSKKDLCQLCRLLVDYGCDGNAQEKLYGQTPVHYLVKQLITAGDYTETALDTLQYLLEKTEPTLGDHARRTALHRAAYARAPVHMIQRLLVCGANLQNSRGETALHEALEADSDLQVITLLAQKTDLRKVTIFGETPLHVAARKGRADAADRLLVLGAPSSLLDLKGNTPLHLAAERGYLPVVRLLCCQSSAELNMYNTEGSTPLHVAVESGFLPVVEFLVETDSSEVKIKTEQLQSALDIAQEDYGRSSQNQISSLLYKEIKKHQSQKII